MKAISIIIMFLALLSCKNSNSTIVNNANELNSAMADKTTSDKEESYKLMKQNCYVCHMPQSKDAMIAPPLFRVKEHYLPVYQSKPEFIDAVVNWAINPSEEKALMPGAVRKFECMPPQAHLSKETLMKIAEYIYDNDMEMPSFFGQMHGGNGEMNNKERQKQMINGGGRNSQIQLDKGRKWKVDKEVIKTMVEVKSMLKSFEGSSIKDFQKFGTDIFSASKQILLNKNNEGEVWDQLHTFFNKMENDMHSLMSVKTEEEGKKLINQISNKVDKFDDFFE